MRVKICGLRTLRDVEAAVEAGADALGFVFAESPRRIKVEDAPELLAAVPAGILKVGVLRDAFSGPLDEMLNLDLDAIQLEPSARWGSSMRRWTVLNDGPDLLVRAHGLDASSLLLVDSSVGGGSGTAADWKRVSELARERPIILAGGLHPDNVAEAIRAVRPCAVDVSSGVESVPGEKDPARIRAFVEAARRAAEALEPGAIPPWPD